MGALPCWVLALIASGVMACGNADEAGGLARLEQAIDVCGATVPSNLVVDGIPAYAQCDASKNSAIYSNNGVDTATSAASSDWKRTQYSGGYQCTELLHRYWLFKWNVSWIPGGNAGTWCDSTPPASSGLVKTTSPVHGDAIVFAPGMCGADSVTGHVALIDSVDATTSKVTFVEQNRAGRRSANSSCASCFLHVVANDGSSSSAGSGSGGSGSGGSGVGGASNGASGSGTSGAVATGGRSGNPTGGRSGASQGGASMVPAPGGSAGRPRGEGGAAFGGTSSGSAGGGSTSSTNAGGTTSAVPAATGGMAAATGGALSYGGSGGTSNPVPPIDNGGGPSLPASGGVMSGGASGGGVSGGSSQAGTSTSTPSPPPAQDESGCSLSGRGASSQRTSPSSAWLIYLLGGALSMSRKASRRRSRR